MRIPSALAFVLVLGIVPTVSTAKEPCTIHAEKGAPKEKLAAMAKVSKADAEKAALSTFKDPSRAAVKEAELEAENGCLVYSFDIAVAGKKGVREIQVDAGNGKVLANKYESPEAEATEVKQEKKDPGHTGKGTGSRTDPVEVVGYKAQSGDEFCVYKVLDKDPGSGGIGLQQPVCILCTADDRSCETESFWIRTIDHKYELGVRDPGHDFCRVCPEGGTTLKKFR